MTHSDAEEDQPTQRCNRPSRPNDADTENQVQVLPITRPIGPGTSQSANVDERNNTGLPNQAINSNSSLPNLSSISEDNTIATGTTSCTSNETNYSPNIDTKEDSSAIDKFSGPINGQSLSHMTTGIDNDISTLNPSTETHSSEEFAEAINDENIDLEYGKIKKKLEKIDCYIEQTTNAMQTLETEGDMSKIGQYNTLVKVMKDLRSSQANLRTHLIVVKTKIDHQNLMDTNNSSQLNEDLESNNDPVRETGSESMGTIGSMPDDGTNCSLHESLNRHQNEQEQLSTRLRESLVRRQELMVRYQATRERLNNLKRQRTSIAQDERNILQEAGSPETPYENPIPGAETWSILQLENSIEDFRLLEKKVDSLHIAYNAKLNATEESDTETLADIQRKIKKILFKRTQIENAITRMIDLLELKREQQSTEIQESTVEPNSVEINSQFENQSTLNVSQDQDAIGAEAMPETENELLAKQQHLHSLKQQLASMKQLLQVTSDSMPVPQSVSFTPPTTHQEILPQNIDDEETTIDNTVVGVNGDIVHLSETERRDPMVVSKYKQLAKAKERLAKMEEVMNCIAEARDSGKPIHQVLSPENLAILAEAQEEELQAENDDLQPVVKSTVREEPSIMQPTINRNAVNELQERRSEWERDSDISAMQHRLKKTTSGISNVNDGSRIIGREKGAIKKQTRNLFCEGNDPRVTEVLVLQEELKEKKNALEALMRKMGKSSSFALDNFSDNISENVSDLNSEPFERPTASWGDGRYFSDPSHSDVEAIADPNEADANRQFPKNKERFNTNKTQRNAQFSVNNLNGSFPRSVRPKQNQNRDETVPVPGRTTERGNQDSSKVQNTVYSAIAQLNQVQETINSLYEDLRNAERTASVQPNTAAANLFTTTGAPPMQPTGAPPMQPTAPFATNPQNLMSNFHQMAPMLNSQTSGAVTNPMVAGLQQCFSQLYLHSIEIQSLNKHLQMINQRDSTILPSHPSRSTGTGSCQQRDDSQPFSMLNPTTEEKHDQYPIYPTPVDARERPNGISNPLYASLNAEASPNWVEAADKNYFCSYNETPASNRRSNNDPMMDSRFPPGTEHNTSSWSPIDSLHMNNQQSSDILNNQVLPGSRANNYWDNFRSYSRQNPLSTAAKSNKGERRSGSSKSLPVNSNERLIRSSENRQYNRTCGSSNSINKASDKNSRSRTRYSVPTDSTPPQLYNLDSSSGGQRQRNRKRNNRLNYVAESCVMQEGSYPNYSRETSEISGMDNYQRVLNDHPYQQHRDASSRGLYENDRFLMHLNRQNTTSQEDLSTSETYSQVIREAESLMQKHSEQPEFLLQLFQHASRITRNTDQHVALELLRELSNQRQQSNIQNNRWNSNSSVTPSENLSAEQPVSVKDDWSFRNNTRPSNKQNRCRRSRGISGSDASESGITSDDDESGLKFSRRTLKNVSPMPTASNASHHSIPQNYSGSLPSCLRISPIPSLAGKCCSHEDTDLNSRIKIENQNSNDRHRSCLEVERGSRNVPFAGASQVDSSGRLVEDCMGRRSHREATQGEERQANFGMKKKNFNVKPNPQMGFETIVSVALREVLLVFEWPENNITSTVQVLDTLHQSIMKQVQMQSLAMGFSTNFVASLESQLKTTLQGFYGKRISQIRQELAATVTQVLIHQYCSLLVHQDNNTDCIQPQTPDSNQVEENKFDKIAPGNRIFNNQSCINSIFYHSESKSKRPVKSNWSYNLSTDRELPREEAKNSVKNLSRTRSGAISKTGTKREESPRPDAWSGSQHSSTPLQDATCSAESGERNNAMEAAQAELVDAEADQCDPKFLGGAHPVHDLAEADQSQADCVLSVDNDGPQQDSPARLIARRNLGANIGLDDVPTRLSSGPDGASPPLSNNIGNRHPPEGGSASAPNSRHPPEGGGAQANYQTDSSDNSD